SEFIDEVEASHVKKVEFNKSNGEITGEFKASQSGKKEFTSSGPASDFQESTVELLQERGVDPEYTQTASNFFLDLIPLLFPILILVLLFVWIGRRQAGQMGTVMNIGFCLKEASTTEKPKTTFGDVAGY